MPNPSPDPDAKPAPIAAAPARSGWGRSIALGVVLLLIYASNMRELGTYDTEPATMMAYTLLRGQGPFLDTFTPVIVQPDGSLLPFATRTRGHLMSLYPLGPSLLALPFEAAQMAYFDYFRPGWDREASNAYLGALAFAKLDAAAIGALIGVALDRLLRRVGLGRRSWLVVLAACLTSELWTIGSQALWQHGPAALAFTVMLALLLPPPPTRLRLVLAGLAAAVMVACRSMDVIFALTALLWVARQRPKDLPWFLPFPLLIGSALIGYHLHFFGTVTGGLAKLEAMHPEMHGVGGPWSGDLLGGMLGTLLSPARGLFVYTPWTAVVLLCLPFYWNRLRSFSLLRWMLVALVANLLMLSKYAVWWGGHCFGPRYWTDAMPLFAVLLGFTLDWAQARRRGVAVLLAVTLAWGLFVQVIGAFFGPSDWNAKPENVDLHHERLWDWIDTEITRCVIQGPADPMK